MPHPFHSELSDNPNSFLFYGYVSILTMIPELFRVP
jgi:hypothetical protein